MQPPMKILVVEDNPGDARLLLEQLKEEGHGAFDLHWVDRLQSAIEAIEKHTYDISPTPFDAVLLDLNLTDSNGLETFTGLHARAPQLPIVLLTGLEDESIGLRAVQIGAQDYLVKGQSNGAAIARALRFSIERNRSLQWHRSKLRHTPGGRVISFLGVKGGVGTTTLALNTAAALAQDKLVAAIEFSGDLGQFAAHFRNRSGPNAHGLYLSPAAAMDAGMLERHLVSSQIGFYLLMGPKRIDECYQPDAPHTARLLELLDTLTDYSVFDVPCAWTPAHSTLLNKSHSVVLVAERDDLSLAAAETMAARVRAAGVAQEALHLAIVNRSPSLDAVTKEKFEQTVGIPVVGLVPPAPDICLACHRAGAPATIFRPRSAPAAAMAAIAHAVIPSQVQQLQAS